MNDSLSDPKNRIYLNSKTEIDFWTKHFRTSVQKLRQAISSVGPYADLVSICLRKNMNE